MATSIYKVLHIEDDPASRLVVKKALSQDTFQYFEAATGIEGLEKVQQISPDLIIMDINLPDIMGVELTTKIKSSPNLNNVVIVALTGVKDPSAREMSLIAGCDGYIAKPINTSQFPEQLLQFLEGKREEVEMEKREDLRIRYEQKLVDRLTQKLQELQLSNQRLTETTSILRDYNQKLVMLLDVLNQMQMCQTPQHLEQMLVDEIFEKLGFDRCIFLEVNFEEMLLNIACARGLDQSEWKKYSLSYNSPFFQNLFQKKQILHIPNTKKITDSHVLQILRRLNSTQFIFGMLGITDRRVAQLSGEESAHKLLDSLVPTLHDHKDIDIEIIQEHLKEYLSSEIFYLGGYLYADYKNSKKRITALDVQILEMLLRNASLIYQNLQLSRHLKHLFIRAERDAITDYLTTLYNYRYFIQQLNREFNRAQRHNSQFVLLMIDIDYFKIYNDTFGHQAGDIVLKKLGKLLQENTRNSDIVARYGGEELAIICPELSREGGINLAEKLRKIIARTPFMRETLLPHKKVTISIGVAAFPDDACSPKNLIRKADMALYRAKHSGRNQVCVCEPEKK